jgi:hypothetical protein
VRIVTAVSSSDAFPQAEPDNFRRYPADAPQHVI